MNLSCDKCFFSKAGMCRVNPPDPMLETLFPPLPSDGFPCGEYLDKENGLPIEEILKRNERKRQYNSLHPNKGGGTNAQNNNDR
jgi:hypothetical protein